MKAKNILLGSIMALSFSPVMAADLIVPEVPTPSIEEVPVAFWTGCYAGIHAGYGSGDTKTSFPFSDYSTEPKGWLGGVQAGCDYQTGAFVIGGVADIALTGLDDSVTFMNPIVRSITFRSKLDALATLRARAGFAVDRTLFYGTGGLAIGRVEGRLSTPFGGQSEKQTHVGWAAGVGIEHAFSEKISIFGEYLHADLGKESYSFGAPLTPQTHELDFKADIFKIGLNYRF